MGRPATPTNRERRTVAAAARRPVPITARRTPVSTAGTGVARAEWWRAQGSQDRERGFAGYHWDEALVDHRRVGARLLPGLSEPARGLHRRAAGETDQLGVRGGEPGLTIAWLHDRHGCEDRRHFRTSTAINAVPICVLTALAPVPTRVCILNAGSGALKNNYMAAIVAAPQPLVRGTLAQPNRLTGRPGRLPFRLISWFLKRNFIRPPWPLASSSHFNGICSNTVW